MLYKLPGTLFTVMIALHMFTHYIPQPNKEFAAIYSYRGNISTVLKSTPDYMYFHAVQTVR